MSLIALALAAAIAVPTSHDGAECDGNTLQINACLADDLTKIEAEHQHYLDTALARLKQEAASSPADPGVAKALQGFDMAERAWRAYRDAECGAVFDDWSSGTIRNAMEIVCRMRLTRLRTHTIWENWLTYMDSTPPVLPEPPLPARR